MSTLAICSFIRVKATMKSVTMRPTDPIRINNFLLSLSIKKMANSINMKLLVPTPTEQRSATDLPNPAISNMLGT